MLGTSKNEYSKMKTSQIDFLVNINFTHSASFRLWSIGGITKFQIRFLFKGIMSRSILRNITQQLIFCLQMGIQCVKFPFSFSLIKGDHFNGLQGLLAQC